jgi:hydrogenase-4 membrane subunit HyfE
MNSLAQGSTGVVLVVGFALLGVRQVRAAVALLAAQAIAVAVAIAMHHQVPAAVGELGLQALAAPIILHKLVNRLSGSQSTIPAGGTKLAVIAGGVLTVLALPWGELGLPLAVMLLGLLLVATRQHPVVQLAGLLAAQNGLVLAASGTGWIGVYSIVLPIVPAFAAGALWLHTAPGPLWDARRPRSAVGEGDAPIASRPYSDTHEATR